MGCGLLPEVLGGAADGVGNMDQGVGEWRGVTLLDPGVGRNVDPGPLAHLLLGEVVVQAYVADLLAQLPAAGEDPFVGRVGRDTRPRSRPHDQL